MTRTDNLSLPQWAAEDPFQRTDFNEAFASLDEGYSEAMAASAELPYVIGSYTSSSSENTTVTLGFKPSFLIISGQALNVNYTYVTTRILITDGSIGKGVVDLTDTGFTVSYTSTTYYPAINNGVKCIFIAFR